MHKMCLLFCIIIILQTPRVLSQKPYLLPPEIIRHPARQVAMVTANSLPELELTAPFYNHVETIGTPFTLECEAIGTPAPKYKWKKNGRWFNNTLSHRIKQTLDKGTLLFVDPEDEDNGWYQCFAENDIGTAASDTAYVHMVQNHPKRYLERETTFAKEGSPFGIKCRLPEGWPKWQVYWVRGSLPVETHRITVDPLGDLWFSYVEIYDKSDEYRCVAKTAYVSIPVSNVKMEIVEAELGYQHNIPRVPKYNEPMMQISGWNLANVRLPNYVAPVLQYVSEPEKIAISGQPTEISCIYGGFPVPAVTWYKNSEVVLDISQHLTLDSFGKILRIGQVKSSDHGNYTCEVTNEGRPPFFSNEAKLYHTTILKVYEAPVFEVEPQNLKARIGGKAVLKCSAFGVPPPRITWYYNGRALPAHTHSRRHFTNQSLTISDVIEADMGNYACNASNEVEYVYKGVYIIVAKSFETSYSEKITLAGIATGLGFLIMVVLFYYVVSINKIKTRLTPADTMVPEPPLCLNSLDNITFDAWHFNRSRLLLLDVLGKGNFGRIFLAEALFEAGVGGETKHKVAVKTTHVNAPDCAQADLLHEVVIMMRLGNHSNVVKLIGACTETLPTYLIMELLSESLHQFLRRAQTNKYYELPVGNLLRVTSQLLLSFAVQTAKGMHHVGTKGIIHRDLAARNILLSPDLVCKISDFGLAREVTNEEVYVRQSKVPLPIRWMAPESLSSDETSVKSDVWSYGVVLWELAALGARPYPGKGANEVKQMVCSGKFMEMPRNCKSEVYDVMRHCWAFVPQQRPDFLDCADMLSALLEKDAEYIDLHDLQDEYFKEDKVDGEADVVSVET